MPKIHSSYFVIPLPNSDPIICKGLSELLGSVYVHREIPDDQTVLRFTFLVEPVDSVGNLRREKERF